MTMRLAVVLFLVLAGLSACGIDGDPLTPPAASN